MEDAFNKLKNDRRNSVDNLIKWMKDFQSPMYYDPQLDIGLSLLWEDIPVVATIGRWVGDRSTNSLAPDDAAAWHWSVYLGMLYECFPAKIVDGVNVTEEKARKLFEDVTDSKNVEIEKFKEAITKLAVEQKKTVEEFTKTLAEEGPKFLSAALAAASAAASTFKETLAKK